MHFYPPVFMYVLNLHIKQHACKRWKFESKYHKNFFMHGWGGEVDALIKRKCDRVQCKLSQSNHNLHRECDLNVH